MNLLRAIISFPNRLKKAYKLHLFKKKANCGANLSVCSKSNISVEEGSSVTIGHDCDILGIISAKCGAEVTVGDYTTIRGESVIGAAAGISIGSHVIISNNVHIYDNNNHPTDPAKRRDLCESGFYSPLWHWRNSDSAPVVIEDNVWIGERATILKGVTIGKGSIVACDSVVTHCAPPLLRNGGKPGKGRQNTSSRLTNLLKMKGPSIDAVLLSIVRIVTLLVGLVCTKIVSVEFSLDSYGLYSQALLIISTACSLSILGMTDAVNFFFNNKKAHASNSPQEYVATVFGLQTGIGGFFGIAILAGAPYLTEYFKNPELWGVYAWIAFQPLLQNLIAMLQVLYISIGRARAMVILNLVLSIIKLAIFAGAAYITHDIITIIALTLVCDLAQILYFVIDLYRHNVTIRPRHFRKGLCAPILKYAIPIAAFVIANSLMRDVDKWVIGYFANTDALAIYTNCSRLLPFDMLTYSFCLVLIPIITRYLSTETAKAAEVYGQYLNLGLITTSILVIPAIFLSRDLLLCLFDPKYLPGLTVFTIYLFVDFVRFANVSLLFNASGQTRQLIKIVLITFALNTILAIGLYLIMGLPGPALATLSCMIISYVMYIRGGSKILNQSITRLFDFRRWLLTTAQCCVAGAGALAVSNLFLQGQNAVIRFLLLYIIVIGILALTNWKHVIGLMRSINQAS